MPESDPFNGGEGSDTMNTSRTTNHPHSIIRGSGSIKDVNVGISPIPSPSTMTRDGETLTTALVGGSGQIGDMLSFIASPNTLNAADHVRKVKELTSADNIVDTKAGINYTTGDTQIQTSGLVQTRTGAWVNPGDGSTVAILPTNTVNYGSDDDVVSGRISGGDYHVRVGITNTTLSLPKKNS